MQNVLPSITGLTVDGVIYQYSANKNMQDPMTVSVQNKDKLGSGYVFRSQDDWTGLRGNTITKVIPVDNILGNRWGDGEISVEGKGTVSDTSVFYKYRYDICVNPLSSPSCPGYAEAMLKSLMLKDVEVIDPLTEEMKKNATENRAVCLPHQILCMNSENKQELGSTKIRGDERRKTDSKSILSMEDTEIYKNFELLNKIPGFQLYSVSIPGGVYNETLRYPDKILPDNRRGRSIGLAQERLHEIMVNSQYDR